MTLKEGLIAKLPWELKDAVADFTAEFDLCDGCKYLLAWTDDYEDCEGVCGGDYPVRSIAEAVRFVKTELHRV